MVASTKSMMRGSKLLLSGVFAAASLLSAQGAYAVDIENSFNLGAIGAPSTTPINNTILGVAGKTFLDHWLFQVNPGPIVNGVAVTMQSLYNAYAISPGSFSSNLFVSGGPLLTAGTTSTFPGGATTSVTYTTLTPGIYDLQVSGTLNGTIGGAYAGTLSAEPVPEPGVLALMAAGLGITGFMRKRSKSS